MQKASIDNVRNNIKGVPVDVRSKAEVFSDLDANIDACSTCKSVFFLNAHCVNQAFRDKEYLQTLEHADYVLNDGIGVDIGAWSQGFKFKENLVGTDFIPEYVEHVSGQSLKVFFFGGRPEALKALVDKYSNLYPNLTINGLDGYSLDIMGEQTLEVINQFEPDILILGLGVPLQEKWADRYKDGLTSVKVLFAGGAIIDNMSGSIKRAPKWIRSLKSEWIYRIYLEPVRLGKRYLFGIPEYFFYILFARPVTR